MGIDDTHANSSERMSIVLPTMDASSTSRRSPPRLPSHYVQPNDVKALANIVADKNSSVENQQQVHVHPLLRSTNSTSQNKPSHRYRTKSDIPFRYNANTDPPHETGRQAGSQATEPLQPDKCSSTNIRPNAHRRSHSVPYNITNDKRSTASSSERSFSAGTIPARIDVQDSILEGLTAQLNEYLQEYGETHGKVAKLYNQIGNHYMRQGQHKLSFENYHNALRCFRLISSSSRSPSPLLGGARRDDDNVTTTLSIAATLGNIGTVQWRMGRLEEAIETLQSAVSTAEDYSGDASQEVANLLFTLGMAHSLKQEYEEAIDCFARMKHIITNIYGPSHVEVARAVDAMGKVCILQGDPSQAIQFHSDALRVKQCALGSRHASVLQTQMNLALAFRADHKYQEALMQLSEVRSARKIALFKEADAERRRSLAGDIGDIACLINEIQRDMNQGDENSSSMGTIDEHREC